MLVKSSHFISLSVDGLTLVELTHGDDLYTDRRKRRSFVYC